MLEPTGACTVKKNTLPFCEEPDCR